MAKKTEKPRILTALTYKPEYYPGFTNTKPSDTMPGQTLSVPEIIARYAQGIPVTNVSTPQFIGEDNEIININKMDISEVMKMKKDLEVFIAHTQTTMQKTMEDENKTKQYELFKKQYEEEQQKGQQKNTGTDT
ncbi:MAG: hypothetical protein [Microviridae sp.]|nr:MAG: hypothetical protein [Microviridae sp.]